MVDDFSMLQDYFWDNKIGNKRLPRNSFYQCYKNILAHNFDYVIFWIQYRIELRSLKPAVYGKKCFHEKSANVFPSS